MSILVTCSSQIIDLGVNGGTIFDRGHAVVFISDNDFIQYGRLEDYTV